MSKERPILFSAPMVRAILEGRKTQTRRVVKHGLIDISLQPDGCHVIHTALEKDVPHGKLSFETNTRIAQRRLYGWERWQDLLKDEVQRLWEEGVRGLVSFAGPPNAKGLLRCQLVAQWRESDQGSSSHDLYGISWDASHCVNASPAFGRKPKEQRSGEPLLGDTSGELAGQESPRSRERGGKTPNVKTDGLGTPAYSVGLRKGVGFTKAYCKDIGYVTTRYTSNLRWGLGWRLWVRETWTHDAPTLEDCQISHEDVFGGKFGPYYKATEQSPETLRWRPSIHMPRWASRITLEIVAVRVERLQDISEEDADAEGFGGDFPPKAFPEFSYLKGWDGTRSISECFGALWDEINGPKSWDANPWVWVVEFRRVEA